MFKKLVGPARSITFATGLVAFFSLISRLFGVLRDRILAGTFGAGKELDIYYAAFDIPDMIFNLVVLGALSIGFIPIFTKLLEKKDGEVCEVISQDSHKEAWNFAGNILNIMILAVLALSISGMLFAKNLVGFLAPGFDLEKQLVTVKMVRIMLLSPIFLSLSSIFGGVLQSFKRFLSYSLAPIAYNLGIIFGALFLTKHFEIYGLAYGVVIGAFLHALLQFIPARKLGFKFSFKINFQEKNAKKLFKLMIPRLMGLATTQANIFFITIIASGLSSGAIAVFNLAENLQYFPIGIFGISSAIAAFPVLSAASDDHKKMAEIFSRVIRKIFFFIFPATILLVVLRVQIIRVILGSGKFDWADTVSTMNTLGFFAISLFAQASIPLLARLYYARHNSLIPFLAASLSVVVNILLAITFSKSLHAPGLALAFSISNILNFVLLWVFWRIKIGSLDDRRIFFSSGKFFVASLACGMSAQIAKNIVGNFVDMSRFWGILTQASFSAIVGITFYIVLLYFLESKELQDVLGKIGIKIRCA